MIRHSLSSIARTALAAAIVTTATTGHATPKISSATIDGDKIIISGSDFGKKEQAAPIMWVFGDDVRLNGKRVDLEKNVAMKSYVPTNEGEDKSLWDRGGGVQFDRVTRDPSISHSYRSEKNGWVGWPYAFGGSSTPYSEKAFISWRMKPSGAINHYKEVAFVKEHGSFLTGSTPYDMGEAITMITKTGRTYSGHIVYIDQDKKHVHLAMRGGSNRYENAKITGEESGAELTVTSKDYYRTASGSKYLRSYETVNQGGTRVIYSTNRWISVQLTKSDQELQRAFDDKGYGVADISKSTKWTLMEAYIDLSNAEGKGYLSANNNKKKWFKNLYIKDSKPSSHGPTISNVGWEAKGGSENIHIALNFGEIYFDKTPQRVVLSSSEKYSKATRNQEFQYIKSWKENQIVVEKWLRSLNSSQPVYLYVFDQYNNVNEKGKCILGCEGNAPPSKISLQIED